MPFYTAKITRGENDWRSYSLVIPAVSVGNVGQLTVDLLISSLYMNKVGYFYDSSFHQMAGNDPFTTSDPQKVCQLVTAVEAYESNTHKLVCIQQRSAIVKGKKQQFIDKLVEFAKSFNFKEVIILGSTYAHERIDSQIQGTQFRYLAPRNLDSETAKIFNNLEWTPLERRDKLFSIHNVEAIMGKDDKVTDDDMIFIPGGGIARKMFIKCRDENLQCIALLTFTMVGDNLQTAILLANQLNTWKGYLDNKKTSNDTTKSSASKESHPWKVPTSWKLHYGTPFDQVCFG